MNNGERFARLFRGHAGRYGRYDIKGAKGPEEKVEGRARTVDEPISLQDYSDHVEGKVGIGVIPLQGEPKEAGTVNFAAIDIDVYKQEDQRAKNLTHEDIAKAIAGTPLIVTKSKSGGIHVWLFSKEPVSARLATDYLQSQAAKLGVAGTEVFPKQTERHSDDDVGNWINLPYFGDSRKAVVPVKKGSVYSYVEPNLETFLKIAEQAAETVTDDWLVENIEPLTDQRTGGESTELWKDGPPCLQSLIVGHPERVATIKRKFERGEITEDQRDKQLAFTEPQLRQGARDDTFFNVGIYLRRRLNPMDQDSALDKEQMKQLEDELKEAHTTWKTTVGDTGLNRGELERLAKQAAKGKWGYACTKEPLKSFCNRRLCVKRKFGVGTTQNDQTAITGFTIVLSTERQYYMTVNDTRIHIPDSKTLHHQNMFANEVLNQTDRMWRTMQDPKYKEMMDELLANADKIDPPPDSDAYSIGLNALYDFVMDKSIAKGQNDSAFFQGRVIWSDDELTAIFKLDQFTAFLRARGVVWTTAYAAKMLLDDYGVIARGNTTIAKRQARPYEVNIKHLEHLMGEVADGEA